MYRKTGNVKHDASTGRIMSMWTKERERNAYNLYCKMGLSMREVAKRLKCSHASVQQLLERKQWVRRKLLVDKPTAAKLAPKIAKLYLQDHVSTTKISERLDVPQTFVCKELKRQGLLSQTKSLSNAYWSAPNRVTYKRSKAVWDAKFSVPDTYEEYTSLVRGLSFIVWTYFSHLVPNSELVEKGKYAADHILSVRDGWFEWDFKERRYVRKRSPISPWIVAHPANVQVVNWADNIRKGGTSYITLPELKNAIKKWEAKHGHVFKRQYQDFAGC